MNSSILADWIATLPRRNLGAATMHLTDGEIVDPEELAGAAFLLIEKGAIEIHARTLPDGKPEGTDSARPETFFVGMLPTGDVFGHERLFGVLSGRRPGLGGVEPVFEAAAFGETVLRVVPLEAVRRDPPMDVIVALAESHERWVARLVEHVESRLAPRLEQVVARLLVGYAEGRPATFPKGPVAVLPREITIERLGRAGGVAYANKHSEVLRKFAAAGAVHYAPKQRIVLADIPRLREIAAGARAVAIEPRAETPAEALARGDNLGAFAAATAALRRKPGDPALTFDAALAAARIGAREEAARLLDELGPAAPALLRRRIVSALDTDDEDPRATRLVEDVLALRARLKKDEAFQSGSTQAALAAAQLYAEAAKATSGYFPSINAASMLAVAGLKRGEQSVLSAAADRARGVLDLLAAAPADYWRAATEAEARLLTGEIDAAETALRAALALPDASDGARASTALQMRRLAEAGMPGADRLAAACVRGSAVVYSGHMMRAKSLPVEEQPGAVATLRRAVAAAVDEDRPFAAWGALACGSDIVIAETLLDRGVALHVVLPFGVDAFIRQSVEPGDAKERDGWTRRFEACLCAAASLTIVGPQTPKGLPRGAEEALHQLAFRTAAGMARRAALERAGTARMIAVHDGGAPDNIAGTGAAVALWRSLDAQLTVVPCGWRKATPATPFSATPQSPLRAALVVAGETGPVPSVVERVETFAEAAIWLLLTAADAAQVAAALPPGARAVAEFGLPVAGALDADVWRMLMGMLPRDVALGGVVIGTERFVAALLTEPGVRHADRIAAAGTPERTFRLWSARLG